MNMTKALGVIFVAGLMWGLGHANADNNRGTRLHTGEEISSITLTRATCPLELSGRTLRSGKHRDQYMLMQIREDEEVLHELLLASDGMSDSFKTVGRTVDKGIAVWIWGTDPGLRAVAGGLGGIVDHREDHPAPPLGIEELTKLSMADLPHLEAVALLDLGDRIVLFLYDSDALTGVRFVSDRPAENPSKLFSLSRTLLAQQQMARIRNVQYAATPGDSGDFLKEWPPQASCCPANCPQCCCHATRTCTSTAATAICDGAMVCKCTGPSSCECGPGQN